jgi:hypothetical protein
MSGVLNSEKETRHDAGSHDRLLRRLAAALDADVRLTRDTTSARHGSNPAQPDLTSTAVSGQKRLPSHTATHHAVEAFNIRR